MANRWAILALLFAVRTCMGFQFQSVPAVAPLYLDTFAISVADIGLLIGLYHAPGFALAIPGGGLGRRYGDARVVTLALVIMLGGTLLMMFASAWSLQVAGRLLAGAGAVLLSVLMSKMVTDWFAGREIATAMGIFVNSWPFGIAIGLLLFPIIAGHGGLLWVNAAVAVAIAASLLALVAFYRPPAALDAAPSTASGWPRGHALRAVIVAGFVWGFFNAGLGVIFGFGPLMLTQRGWSLAAASGATSIVLWLVAVTTPIGGLLADRSGRHVTVLVATATLLALGLLAAAHTAAPLVAFAALGLIAGLPAGPIMSLPSRVLLPNTRTMGMAIFFTTFFVIQAAGPWIAGRAAAATGTVSTTFDLGAVFLVIGMALVAVFLRLADAAHAKAPVIVAA